MEPVEVNPGVDAGELDEAREGGGTAVAIAPEPEEALRPEEEEVSEQLFIVEHAGAGSTAKARLKAVLEAAIYVTDEPLSLAQIAAALEQPAELVRKALAELMADYAGEDRGLTVREVAGGYKMGTKPEHHEQIRAFVKNLKPPLKLSLPALETLAVIAYKQPITAPEIMEIRGVQGAGVLKTLLDRKLIATAGRKQVVGKPILYRTTKEFLIQFGLKDLSELPTLKEFEELGRLALNDSEGPAAAGPHDQPGEAPVPVHEPQPEPEPVNDPDPQTETAGPGPKEEPPDSPPAVKEPGPDPEPERDPHPQTEPGGGTDPQRQPVEG